MRTFWKAVTVALLATASVVACSPSDFIEYDLGVDDGSSEGVKETLKVDGSSEAHLTLPTGAALTFEKGAVDRHLEVAMERPSDEKALPFVKALAEPRAVASAPYVLTPHGTQFKGKVVLELPLAKSSARPHVVAYLEDENDRDWKLIGRATVEGGKARVELKHFSVVILLDAERSGLLPADDSDPDVGASEAGAPRDAAANGAPADAGASEAPEDGGVDVQEPPDVTPPDASVPGHDDAGAGNLDASVEDAAIEAGAPPPDASVSDAGPDAYVVTAEGGVGGEVDGGAIITDPGDGGLLGDAWIYL